jgi:hypothetical protein
MTTAAELDAQARTARRVADELAQQALEARRAEEEARKPKMPVVDADATPVVVFSRYQSGREYAYAAIGWRVGRSVRWAVTGHNTQRFNWPGLLNFIGESNWATLRHVVTTVPLLPEGEEPPVAETMGSYGRVKSVDTVTPFTDYGSVAEAQGIMGQYRG